jgi:hypothetical protein
VETIQRTETLGWQRNPSVARQIDGIAIVITVSGVRIGRDRLRMSLITLVVKRVMPVIVAMADVIKPRNVDMRPSAMIGRLAALTMRMW